MPSRPLNPEQQKCINELREARINYQAARPQGGLLHLAFLCYEAHYTEGIPKRSIAAQAMALPEVEDLNKFLWLWTQTKMENN